MSNACPDCGARNPDHATWCGQCFRSLESRIPGSGPAVGGPGEGAGRQERLRQATWTCRRCETANPVEDGACGACGLSIFKALGVIDDPRLEPSEAVRASLVLPGRGHAKLGQGALGGLIGATALFGIGLGAVVWSAGSGAGALMVTIGLGVYLVAARDAHVVAAGQPGLLRPRAITVIFAALFLVLLFAVWQVQAGP